MWTLFEIVWGIVSAIIALMWVGFTIGPARSAEGVGHTVARTVTTLVLFTTLYFSVYAAVYAVGFWLGWAPLPSQGVTTRQGPPLADNVLAVPAILLLNSLGIGRKWQVALSLLAGSVLLPVVETLIAAAFGVDLFWPLIYPFASAANNVAVLVVIAVVLQFLWVRWNWGKWVATLIVVTALLLMGQTREGRLLLSLTSLGVFTVVERWRLWPDRTRAA